MKKQRKPWTTDVYITAGSFYFGLVGLVVHFTASDVKPFPDDLFLWAGIFFIGAGIGRSGE